MSDKVILPEDGSVVAALDKVRKAETDSFAVIGYDPDHKNTLAVIATGEGGLNAAKEYLPSNECRYVLLRKFHKVEMAKTTKFAFIDWTPGAIPPMRKALLSTHKSQIELIMKPFHVSLQASDESELDEDTINEKIGLTSGTKSYVTDKPGATELVKSSFGSNRPPSGPKGNAPNSIRDEQKVKFENEEEVVSVIKTIRQDNGGLNWCLVGYSSDDTLTLLGKGSNGVDEMSAALEDDRVYYGFFRVTETIDKSVTVKFGFLKLVADSMPPMKKAKITTHYGAVTRIFQPYHVEFLMDNKKEFTLEAVMNKIQSYTGTRSHVRDNIEVKTEKKDDKHKGPSVPKSTGGVTVDDEEAFKAALNSVRKDENVTWLIARLEGKNKVQLLCTGSGHVDDILEKLESDNVNWALLRVIDVIDKSKTTKFVYFKWTPDSVPPMKKAGVSVIQGQVDQLFRPYHVDFHLSAKSDVTREMVEDKVGVTSGSKSKEVLERPEN